MYTQNVWQISHNTISSFQSMPNGEAVGLHSVHTQTERGREGEREREREGERERERDLEEVKGLMPACNEGNAGHRMELQTSDCSLCPL